MLYRLRMMSAGRLHRPIGRPSTAFDDPFSVRPIRRALALCAVCAAVLVLPWQISSDAGVAVMLSIGWLALTGLVFGIPVLILSVAEAIIDKVRDRLHPPIESIGLSPRVTHLLTRHGYRTVQDLRAASDADLQAIANMDWRSLQEIRRKLAVDAYRCWQDAGYPAGR